MGMEKPSAEDIKQRHRENARAYYYRNREKVLERVRKYCQDNREKERARVKKWRMLKKKSELANTRGQIDADQ
jgi:DNA-binding transcriptional regulator PaaX